LTTVGCGRTGPCRGYATSTAPIPGFTRRRRGNSFSYVDVRERPIRNAETVERIRELAIPPTWRDVWIRPAANDHLQAVETDDLGGASTCTSLRGASTATVRSSTRWWVLPRPSRWGGARSVDCSARPTSQETGCSPSRSRCSTEGSSGAAARSTRATTAAMVSRRSSGAT
jgi:hypothetical protein